MPSHCGIFFLSASRFKTTEFFSNRFFIVTKKVILVVNNWFRDLCKCNSNLSHCSLIKCIQLKASNKRFSSSRSVTTLGKTWHGLWQDGNLSKRLALYERHPWNYVWICVCIQLFSHPFFIIGVAGIYTVTFREMSSCVKSFLT